MAKTIGLNIKIQSQGGEKVIKNINELETEIAKLSEELKGLDFGTEEYKKTAASLNTLKSSFKDVEKEFEGIDTEQKLTALAGATEAVSGAFLIASSAARTFGAEAKSVEEIEQLERQALEAVNIALGIRQLLEGALQARILLRNASEKVSLIQTNLLTAAQTAYNVVVGTSTGLLKAFRLALAGTGIGLAIVAITELISRFRSANDEIEKATDSTFNYAESNIKAQQEAAASEVKIKSLTRIVKDGNESLQTRKAAYDELVKIVPELSNYTLEEALAQERLNAAVSDQIALISLRARATALEEYLVEQEKARIAAEAEQRQLEEATENLNEYIELQREYNQAVAGGFQGTLEEFKKQEEARKSLSVSINEQTGELELNTNATEDNKDALADLTPEERELFEIQQEIARITGEVNQRTEEYNKTVKDGEKTLDDYNKKIEEQSRKLGQLASAFKNLEFNEEASAEILDEANELLDKQNALLEERAKILGIQIGVNDDYTESLRRLVGGVIIPDDATESVEQFQDVFKKVLDSVIKVGQGIDDVNTSSFITTDGASELLFILDNAQDNLERMVDKGYELEDALKILNEPIYNSFRQLNDEQKSLIINFLKSQEQAKSLIDDLNDGIINYNDNLKKGEDTIKLANTQNLEIFNLIVATNDALANRINNLQTEEEVRKNIESQVAKQLFDQEDLTKLSEEQLEVVQGTTDLIFDQAKFYGDVLKVNKELAKVTGEISDNITEQSEKLTDAEFGNLFEKIKNDAETNLPALKKFFSELSADTSNLTQEQLDNINTFLNEFTTGLNRSWEEMSWNEKVQQLVQVMNDLTSKIQGIAQAQISLELERLAAYEEQTLRIIGDETEAQREKQREFQEEINKQRFELEKKARIQELQFAVASSIASGAQAVVNALALPIPPPGPQIIAALYAGLTAVEIATINDQLNFVKSTQYVARRGGLVNGPSHEDGGVMMNGGMTLEGGEFIVNRNATAQYADILSQINTSTGGRALAMDDSRIVQEIRKQNQRPIKTYVMYEDIKNTNKINAKLEEISRL